MTAVAPAVVAKAEPAKQEPAKPEPAKPEPAKVEVNKTDAAKTDAAKHDDTHKEGAGRFVVQVGAFSEEAKVRELRSKVEKSGLKTYTQEAHQRGQAHSRACGAVCQPRGR